MTDQIDEVRKEKQFVKKKKLKIMNTRGKILKNNMEDRKVLKI